MKRSFLEEFKKRGYFYQCTNPERLQEITDAVPIVAYTGFDCTATSLHAGSLIQIMILRLLQQHGHKPIIILGGATSKIGDPSFRADERKLIDEETITKNFNGIKYSLSKFLKLGDGKNDALLLNNSDWLENLGYIEFLRDFGKLFSVNKMLSMDSVRLRLEREQNLSFLEFNYMLLQSYDFFHLNKNYNCALQIGGSDQWGNIISGTDLIRRLTGSEAFGLTTPLLTTSSGAKMGKTAAGAVWLNEDLLSPYEYFQYWRNIDDADVVKFSKLFAEFNDEEQKNFEILVLDNINEAKKQLALKITSICHGKQNAVQALDASIELFEKGSKSVEGLPEITMDRAVIQNGITVTELFFMAGLCESKSETRKLIRAGAARINDEKVIDENAVITQSDYDKAGYLKLSLGKKKHLILKL